MLNEYQERVRQATSSVERRAIGPGHHEIRAVVAMKASGYSSNSLIKRQSRFNSYKHIFHNFCIRDLANMVLGVTQHVHRVNGIGTGGGKTTQEGGWQFRNAELKGGEGTSLAHPLQPRFSLPTGVFEGLRLPRLNSVCSLATIEGREYCCVAIFTRVCML